jgi:hypothetical protein
MKNEFSVNQLLEYFDVIWSDIYSEDCQDILEKHERRKLRNDLKLIKSETNT